ncbi:hypothetical protein [Pontibacter rugosus]|uniref:Uncharacterized protein n=1 Tax=Pontibacter rugosus TaxID=1745966 RepID=A0ABW3SJ86_9BACT
MSAEEEYEVERTIKRLSQDTEHSMPVLRPLDYEPLGAWADEEIEGIAANQTT